MEIFCWKFSTVSLTGMPGAMQIADRKDQPLRDTRGQKGSARSGAGCLRSRGELNGLEIRLPKDEACSRQVPENARTSDEIAARHASRVLNEAV